MPEQERLTHFSFDFLALISPIFRPSLHYRGNRETWSLFPIDQACTRRLRRGFAGTVRDLYVPVRSRCFERIAAGALDGL